MRQGEVPARGWDRLTEVDVQLGRFLASKLSAFRASSSFPSQSCRAPLQHSCTWILDRERKLTLNPKSELHVPIRRRARTDFLQLRAPTHAFVFVVMIVIIYFYLSHSQLNSETASTHEASQNYSCSKWPWHASRPTTDQTYGASSSSRRRCRLVMHAYDVNTGGKMKIAIRAVYRECNVWRQPKRFDNGNECGGIASCAPRWCCVPLISI